MEKQITREDETRRRQYEACLSDALGDLHQRMKAVMEIAERNYDKLPQALWQALWDLQTEVQYHVPAKPPFGHRLQSVKQFREPVPWRTKL